MGKWVVLLLVVTTAASARAEVAPSQADRARRAAQRGDCELARKLASLVREANAGGYAALSRDPALHWCVARPDVEVSSDPLNGAASVVIETLFGGIIGLPGLVGGGFIGAAAGGGVLSLYTAGIGAYAGWTLAAPIGVYIAGKHAGYGGSKAATEVGSILGGAGGLLIADRIGNEKLAVIVLLAAPVVGAVIGYNVTRSTKREHALAISPVLDVSHDHTVAGLGGRF